VDVAYYSTLLGAPATYLLPAGPRKSVVSDVFAAPLVPNSYQLK
jgi:hypothetical protein